MWPLGLVYKRSKETLKIITWTNVLINQSFNVSV